MLTYLSNSIWASQAQTLVNTVNVVGGDGAFEIMNNKKIAVWMIRKWRF